MEYCRLHETGDDCVLRAIASGKKTGSGLQGISIRLGDFDGAEDLLTAAVFSRLMYFSDERIAAIFLAIPEVSKLWPLTAGALRGITFWPRFYDAHGSYVEPDVLIELEGVDLLIEAKRYDDAPQQRLDQLIRQREAILDEREKPTIQVAVGGLTAQHVDGMHASNEGAGTVCFVHWRDLLKIVLELDSPSAAERRLISDIRLAFRLHGIGRDRVVMGSLTSATPISLIAFPQLSLPAKPISHSLQDIYPVHLHSWQLKGLQV